MTNPPKPDALHAREAAANPLREKADIAATWALQISERTDLPGGIRVAAKTVSKHLRAALSEPPPPAPVGAVEPVWGPAHPQWAQRVSDSVGRWVPPPTAVPPLEVAEPSEETLRAMKLAFAANEARGDGDWRAVYAIAAKAAQGGTHG